MTATPHTHDVIVVLGTALLGDGTPSAALRARVLRGVALFRQGRAKALLVTGGLGVDGLTEAAAMRALAITEGVPEGAIVAEPDARTTLENALYATRLMRARGWTTALVVSDRLHLMRALLVFRSLGVAARGSAVSALLPHGPRGGLWATLAYVAHELIGLVWYVLVVLVKRPRP